MKNNLILMIVSLIVFSGHDSLAMKSAPAKHDNELAKKLRKELHRLPKGTSGSTKKESKQESDGMEEIRKYLPREINDICTDINSPYPYSCKNIFAAFYCANPQLANNESRDVICSNQVIGSQNHSPFSTKWESIVRKSAQEIAQRDHNPFETVRVMDLSVKGLQDYHRENTKQ